MKSAKITAIILSLLLAVLSFSACGSKDDTGDTTTSAEATSASSAAEIPTEPSTEEPGSEATSEVTKVETESIDTVLSLIKSFPMGTAGSSKKSVDIALHLMNFAEACQDTDEVKEACKSFYSKLTYEEKMMFEENLVEINVVARRLLAGANGSLEEQANNSSEKYDKGNYSTEKYNEIFDIIKNV